LNNAEIAERLTLSQKTECNLSWPFTSRALINATKSYQQSEIGISPQSNPRRIKFLAMTRLLEPSDKFLNRIVSGVRIRVEHVIAGVKRCRIVKDVFRNLTEGFSDLVMEVACALHNFRISFRHPQPTVNLLDFIT
jgi:DDE superfamily endonuclease